MIFLIVLIVILGAFLIKSTILFMFLTLVLIPIVFTITLLQERRK